MVEQCVQNFDIVEWILFGMVVAFVLFIMYPRTNGDFDDEYLQSKEPKEKHWWEEEDR